MTTRIVLIDDHILIRSGLRKLLESQSGLQVVGEADDGRAGVELARQLSPDIILIDISMPGLNGIDATRQIIAATPSVKIIALSMHSDRQFVTEMVKAGAMGYLLKSSAQSELMMAVQAVSRGQVYLSPQAAAVIVDNYVRREDAKGIVPREPLVFATLSTREREVLQLLAEGKTSKEIAITLSVSVKTIETHRAQIMDKVGIRTIAELTKYAVRQGLTDLE